MIDSNCQPQSSGKFFEHGSKPSTKRGSTYRTGSANAGFSERILLYRFSVPSLDNVLCVATTAKTELMKVGKRTFPLQILNYMLLIFICFT
jgi:hypothetical protein